MSVAKSQQFLLAGFGDEWAKTVIPFKIFDKDSVLNITAGHVEFGR